MVKRTIKLNAKKIKATRTLRKTVQARTASRNAASRNAMSNSANPTFGNVSTITTAPVAIGNSMTGFKAQSFPIKDGVRILGRDFGFTPAATGTVTGWAFTGGMPLTPACMPTTALRSYCQIFSKFKVNKIIAHYITSSSTATTGDVVFYAQKTTGEPMVNWTSASFLPFVLSDGNTVIGPQWTNHSILIEPKGTWLSTDYGMNTNQMEVSAGDLILFSKTSSTESPGYVVLDYDITFMNMNVSPRSGVIPAQKAQWNQFAASYTGAQTANVNMAYNAGGISPVGIGGTQISAFTVQIGDIFKIVIDVTNSTFATTTAANFFNQRTGSGTVEAITLTDGFTCYGVAQDATPALYLYNSFEAALVTSNAAGFYYGATVTYNEMLRGFLKYIGNQNSYRLQYSV